MPTVVLKVARVGIFGTVVQVVVRYVELVLSMVELRSYEGRICSTCRTTIFVLVFKTGLTSSICRTIQSYLSY